MKPRLITILVLLALATALMGACGSSGSDPGEDVGANQPASEVASDDQPDAEETGATEEEEEEAVSCLDGPPSKTKFTVAARDDTPQFSFRPRKVEAPADQEITIVYVNKAVGPEPHNLTIDSLHCGTGQVDKASITFTMPSDVTEFSCTFHPFMTGKLVPTA